MEIFTLTKSLFRGIRLTMNLLTTKEAASRLDVTVRRVHQFIEEGRLPAEKMGRDYFIQEGDLKLVEDRKPGRPPKVKAESSKASKKGGKK
ncbi:MAG TPA: helix-turn-helix domain-containing protein [Pyrinomonadaceae bacterium]